MAVAGVGAAAGIVVGLVAAGRFAVAAAAASEMTAVVRGWAMTGSLAAALRPCATNEAAVVVRANFGQTRR